MSTSSGWDYPPPPMHDPARPPQGHTSEPVGYNLGNVPRYEQPPVALVPPTDPYSPGPLPTGQATAGFVFGLVGLLTAPVLPVFTVALVVLGLMISANALSRCRRGLAAGRGRATAGVILGILGLALTLFMILDFMTGSVRLGP